MDKGTRTDPAGAESQAEGGEWGSISTRISERNIILLSLDLKKKIYSFYCGFQRY